MSLVSPSEVFLSPAHQDKDFASSLAETLRDHTVPVWYSPTNILAAQQWLDEIGEALERCDWFIVILSPAAVQFEMGQKRTRVRIDREPIRQSNYSLALQAVQSEGPCLGAD